MRRIDNKMVPNDGPKKDECPNNDEKTSLCKISGNNNVMEKKTPQRKGKIKSTKKDQRRKKFSHTSN
jgi:hypothetical protein